LSHEIDRRLNSAKRVFNNITKALGKTSTTPAGGDIPKPSSNKKDLTKPVINVDLNDL